MPISRSLKSRSLQLLAAVAVILTLLGGVKLGTEITAPHATPAHVVAPSQHLQACGGVDGLPPCW